MDSRFLQAYDAHENSPTSKAYDHLFNPPRCSLDLSTTSLRTRTNSAPYKSRFIEDSMHDRPSVCPPARFLGTSESLDDSANFTANNENVKSVYAFGEVAATAVTSAWKNVNKLWSGTSETPKRPALLFEPLPPSSYSEGLSALFDDPPERHESPQKPYEDVSNHHEDLPKPYEDISNRHEDLPKPYENIPKHDEDLPEPYENVPKDHEDLSEPYEDVPKDPEDLPKPYEDVPKDHEDLSKLYENVPKDYESLSDLYEHNLKDQESLSKPYEEPPKQHEGLQECQETGKRDSGIEMSPDMPKPMTIKFATPISRDASLDYTSEQEDRKPSLLNRPSLHSLKTVTSRFNLRARTRSARPELEAPTESVASSSMKSVKSKASRSKLKKIDKKVERLQRQLEKAQAERTLLTVDGVNIDDEKASTKENVRTFSVGKKRKTEEAEVGQAGEEHATLPSALKKRKSVELKHKLFHKSGDLPDPSPSTHRRLFQKFQQNISDKWHGFRLGKGGNKQ